MIAPRFCAVVLSAISLAGQGSPEALIRDGHLKRARAMVEPKFRSNPNDPETLWLMSWIRQDWKDLKAAREYAEKAVAADPRNARYHLRLAEVVGDELESAGTLRQLGLAKHFKKEIDTTVALDPRNIEALKHLVEYYFGSPGFMGGDKTKGRATVEQIASLDPAEGYLAQAIEARLEKQGDRIENLYRKAVEAKPSSYEAQVLLGNACIPAKKLSEAEAHAREAIRLDPGRAGGHSLLAGALANQDKWAELDTALAASEKSVPDDLQPYFRASNVCLAKGTELPRAERYLRKYLSQEPEPQMPSRSRAHWRLGLILEKQVRKAEAIAEFETAAQMDPASPAKEELKKVR
ncbi:MAG: tetratricopeptide repeat protein [Acidobacteriia bacterium]|nr:tetratricopeptide repeat protein [Terriglobia bacterium]